MDWTGLVIMDSNVQVIDQDPDELEALLPTLEATLHESIVPQGPTEPPAPRGQGHPPKHPELKGPLPTPGASLPSSEAP